MKNILMKIKREILNMEVINEEELNKIFAKYGLSKDEQEAIINHLLSDDPIRKPRVREVKEIEPTKEELEQLELEEKEMFKQENTSRNTEVSTTGYTPDPIKNYLMEIGNIPLLSKDEERLLFLEIEKKRKEITDCTEEDRKLALEDELDVLQKKAAEHNLRLVVSIAKYYSGRGLDLLDLIQEGNLGLMRAIELFEVEKGFKFSTYAHWWIKQAITRSIADKARTIRIPVHMSEQVNRFTRREKMLAQKLQRDPTEQELADEFDMSLEKVKELKLLALPLVSLQSPIGQEEDTQLIDFIEDDGDSLEEQVDQIMLKKYLDDFLNKRLHDNIYGTEPGQFKDRELEILKLRFGFNETQEPYTLEDIGQKYDITRERVRQIENKALLKLKHHNNKVGKHIKTYSRGRNFNTR